MALTMQALLRGPQGFMSLCVPEWADDASCDSQGRTDPI